MEEPKQAEEPKELKWLLPAEENILVSIREIKNKIAAAGGLLSPMENQKMLGILTNYYETFAERDGRYKSMRDELFGEILAKNPDVPIGRAEGIAKGSVFGQKHTYYEHLAAGLLEMLNTLKKQQEYQSNVAKNQY